MYLECFLNIKQFGTKCIRYIYNINIPSRLQTSLSSIQSIVLCISGLFGAVSADWRPVESREGGELGGAEGELIKLNVLQAIPPPRPFAENTEA